MTDKNNIRDAVQAAEKRIAIALYKFPSCIPIIQSRALLRQSHMTFLVRVEEFICRMCFRSSLRAKLRFLYRIKENDLPQLSAQDFNAHFGALIHIWCFNPAFF